MAEYISTGILLNILINAKDEERLALSKIINEKTSIALDPKALLISILNAGGHGIFNTIRGKGISYAELLYDACSIAKVNNLTKLYSPIHEGISLNSLDLVGSTLAQSITEDVRATITLNRVDSYERKLLAQITVAMYERMTPEERRKVDEQVIKLSKTLEGGSLKGLSTSAALLVIGNLGGFATYTLLSSILGALSMGTLSFGVYTLASSMLSVVLGPVGWLALGGYALYKFGGPNPAKVLQLAATCSMIDQRLRSCNDPY